MLTGYSIATECTHCPHSWRVPSLKIQWNNTSVLQWLSQRDHNNYDWSAYAAWVFSCKFPTLMEIVDVEDNIAQGGGKLSDFLLFTNTHLTKPPPMQTSLWLPLYYSEWKNVNRITSAIDCMAIASYSTSRQGKGPHHCCISRSEWKKGNTITVGHIINKAQHSLIISATSV